MKLTQRSSPVIWRKGPIDPRLHAYSENGYYQESAFYRNDEIHAAFIEAISFRENFMGEGIIYERDGKTVRSIFGVQDTNHRLVDLVCTDKLINLAMAVLGSDVYIHQFHINYKQAWIGGGYDWHSDYTYWHWEDGMPHPRCVSMVIPLEKMRYENGPLFVHGGSHLYYGHSEFYRHDELDPDDEIKHDEEDSGGITQDQREIMASDMSRYGGPMHVIWGDPGDLCMMDANLLHMSQPNWSPWDRTCAFLCLNSVENALEDPRCGRPPRPHYITNRDSTKHVL